MTIKLSMFFKGNGTVSGNPFYCR